MTTRLGTATGPEAAGADTVLVPIGALEQHGPHLPLDTDTRIAVAVAEGLAARLAGAWIAPAIPYGASGEHQDFAGTSSIGLDGVELVLVELIRSMTCWARRVIVVNGHGGNVVAVDGALGRLRDEGRRVHLVPCAAPGLEGHAGRGETSVMLSLAPETVRLEAARPGNTAPMRRLLPELRSRGVRAVAPNGVLGDPRGASAEEGRRILAEIVDRGHAGLAALASAGSAR